MSTRIFRICMMFALLTLILSGASATTVMVSYDLIMDAGEDMKDEPYIVETSIDFESGIMDDLFNNGHIVFNAPGKVFTDAAGNTTQQSNLANRRMEASTGGARYFIYLKLYYDGSTEDELRLVSAECKVFNLDDGARVLAEEKVYYDDPGASPVNGAEASRILLNRLAQIDLF